MQNKNSEHIHTREKNVHFASAAYASSVLLPVFLLPACYLIELYTLLGVYRVLSRPLI